MRFNNHKEECRKIVPTMPIAEEAIISFKNGHKESMLQPINEILTVSSANTHKHVACAFSYYIKCSFNDSYSKFNIHFGVDAPEMFVKTLVSDATNIYSNHLSKIVKMTLTTEQVTLHTSATNCHICGNILNSDPNDNTVRDHCHLTGIYRGAAHNSCNLKYRTPKFIPVLFHNMSSYDSHLFFKELAKVQNSSIKVIPITKEKYISITLTIKLAEKDFLEIRFLDSFRFMSSSLDSLANNLSADDFNTVRANFCDENQFNLIKRKGVFPYSYMDSMQRFNETELPSRENFFNILNDVECSVEDYEHAQKVWEEFKCETLLDYTKLYLKTDVLLLTDIFQNFRKICKNIYQLDPCHYFTAPGLSWDAMLKTTKIKLEIFTDQEMYNFIHNGIRGGLVQCSKRYSKANNKYLLDYDSSKPSEYLMYLDANNLYGWAMSQYLPYGDFQWLDEESIEFLDIFEISDTSDFGYILEVDLAYPDSLHNAHNDLPFCPKNKINGNAKCKNLSLT